MKKNIYFCSKNCGGGEWTAKAWPCGKLESGEWQRYHGRGAKQLSYNYNYGQVDPQYLHVTFTLSTISTRNIYTIYNICT